MELIKGFVRSLATLTALEYVLLAFAVSGMAIGAVALVTPEISLTVITQ